MKLIRRVAMLPMVAVLLLLAGPGLVVGQRGGGTHDRAVDFQIVRLRYVKASETATLLQNILGTDAANRLVADERTNSLLIRATPPRITEIREVLKRIDIEGADGEAAPTKISIFGLRSLQPDKALEEALRVVIGKTSTGVFAVDKTRKTVIVSADKMTTEAVEALLARLDIMGTNRPDEDVQVRIFWLVPTSAPAKGTDEGEVGSPPPEYIKEVLPVLTKLGIDRPRVLAQLGVNTKPNTLFQVKGTLGRYQLSVSGRFNSGPSSPGLKITIQAKDEEAKKEICNLQTEIGAPSGHLVVLGMTPIEHLSSSAFVVQVLRKEGKVPAPRK